MIKMETILILIMVVLCWVVIRQIQLSGERSKQRDKFWRNLEEFDKIGDE
jgi:hypothetical protein